MTAVRAARCERSDLPPEMCAHCRGHVLDVELEDTRLTSDEVGPRFTANYSTPCNAGCGGTIQAGESIAALVNGYGYACPGCLP